MRHATAVWLVIVGIAGTALLHAQDGPYRFAREIAIGGEGGWDYLSVDPAAHRLYVSHATKVVVIDTQADKVVGEIADTPGVHGFAIAADLGRGFSSNGRENKVSIVDLKTLKTLAEIQTGKGPDAITFDPSTNRVFTMNKGNTSTAINATVTASCGTSADFKLKLAGKFGAVVVNAAELNPIEELMRLTDGRGVDVALELIGLPTTMSSLPLYFASTT